jgi:ribosomal protein S18 acetylase RimI-like enzyme
MSPLNLRTDPPRIRLAKAEDLARVVHSLGVELFAVAGFDQFAEPDFDRGIAVVGQQLTAGTTVGLIAEHRGAVVGWASYTLDHVFTKRPIAHLDMICASPAYRRGPLGRMLLAQVLNLAQGDNACAFFATIPPTASLGRSLCNLLRRAGCQPMGGAFTRRL